MSGAGVIERPQTALRDGLLSARSAKTIQRVEACKAAEDMLSGLSDKERVNFALALVLKTKDADAAAPVRFAANQLVELANILEREAFEQANYA